IDITLRYQGAKRFEAVARGHHVVSDQPPEKSGADTGMTPPELFLSSIAACAGYYAAEDLNVRNLPAEGLEIRVSAEKGDKPVRLTGIRLEVTAPGLNQRHRDGVLRAVDACLLKHTLTIPPRIEVSVESQKEVEAAAVLAH